VIKSYLQAIVGIRGGSGVGVAKGVDCINISPLLNFSQAKPGPISPYYGSGNILVAWVVS